MQVGETREKLHLWWDDRVIREDVDASWRVERVSNFAGDWSQRGDHRRH